MAEEANDGSPPSGPHLWTLFFDDGTKDGLRVDCTEEKVAEYILSRRATASTPTLAPGASERVPLAEIPRFAPIFNGAEANAITRVAGMDQAARLRTFSTLCKVCERAPLCPVHATRPLAFCCSWTASMSCRQRRAARCPHGTLACD